MLGDLIGWRCCRSQSPWVSNDYDHDQVLVSFRGCAETAHAVPEVECYGSAVPGFRSVVVVVVAAAAAAEDDNNEREESAVSHPLR